MASDVVRCPRCGVPVEPSWDWCQNCSYDPVHLKPDDWQAATAPAPETASSRPPPPSATPTPSGPPEAWPGPAPATGGLATGTATALAPGRSPAPAAARLATPTSPVAGGHPHPTGNGGGPTSTDAPAIAARPVTTAPAPVAGPEPARASAPPSRLRRPLAIATIVVVIAALVSVATSVLGGGTSTTTQEHQLNAKLLSVSDLPQGWRVVPPSTDLPTTALSCLSGSTQTNARVPTAAIGFGSPIGVPNLVEVLEDYSTAGAVQRFDQLTRQVFHGCPSSAKPSTSAGIGQTQLVVLPQVGDESAAVAVPTAGGTTSTVVVARTGGIVVYLTYETHGPPDTNLLQLVTIRALAKASSR